ncbi:MAG: CDP-alcohol phosphatidyltransferase family protein [Alphaproteobacteria bacterium]|uniref:CDP-alcohol phosphatidyltransferase family protein n=1 Tax=Candidatus Nitrobium versatile TaxID=2884831 RepID=A0A953JD79_9BACT|nr:CDP-alcohol phosphatidyltransferase family protein [Candidatus Nitrobium versatile]
MLGAKLGHFLDKPLAPLAKRISLSPNVLSMLGFLITVVAAGVLPFHLRSGGLLVLLGGFFDMLDGVVARTNGKKTTFGAFLDSTLDRYSDSLLFLAVAWYFFDRNNLAGVLLTIGGLIGALLISYVRARAEGLGIDCHVGLMERPERIVLLAAGCMTKWLFPVIIVLFLFSHITVLQRILHVRGRTRGM